MKINECSEMGDNYFTEENKPFSSRGQQLVNLAQEYNNNDYQFKDFATVDDDISNCSSPPPSLTELKVRDKLLCMIIISTKTRY